jgi:hypothetical protein
MEQIKPHFLFRETFNKNERQFMFFAPSGSKKKNVHNATDGAQRAFIRLKL